VAGDNVSNEYAVSRANLTRDISVEPVPGPGTGSTGSAAPSPIQGIVEGSFTPLGSGAEVTLRLVSTANNKVLGSSRFVIPVAELDKRGLALYPPRNGTVITPVEFDRKQALLAPYNGKNNAFGFTIQADVLDGLYYENDFMTIRLYAEKDCYFKILQVNVNGEVQVLYPRSAKDDNFIRAGQTRRIPDNTRFRITPPFGEEYVLAAAYANPFEPTATGAVPLSSSALTRDITVEDKQTRAETKPLATAKFSYTPMP
jgi:hypothetical protein